MRTRGKTREIHKWFYHSHAGTTATSASKLSYGREKISQEHQHIYVYVCIEVGALLGQRCDGAEQAGGPAHAPCRCTERESSLYLPAPTIRTDTYKSNKTFDMQKRALGASQNINNVAFKKLKAFYLLISQYQLVSLFIMI